MSNRHIKTNKPHYINNAEFHEALVAYEQQRKLTPEMKIPNYVGKCISLICEGLSMRPNFSGYTFREEMVGDAVENCLLAIRSYNTKYTKPFSYFTQIAWFAFVRRINDEQKQTYTKHKNMLNYPIDYESFNYSDSGNQIMLKRNDISEEIIAKFETKLALTKQKKSPTIRGIEAFVKQDATDDDIEWTDTIA